MFSTSAHGFPAPRLCYSLFVHLSLKFEHLAYCRTVVQIQIHYNFYTVSIEHEDEATSRWPIGIEQNWRKKLSQIFEWNIVQFENNLSPKISVNLIFSIFLDFNQLLK